MRFLTILLLFTLLFLVFGSEMTFEEFKVKFNRVYKDAKEEAMRKKRFEASVKEIEQLRIEKPYGELKLKITDFADWTREEWNGLFHEIEMPKADGNQMRTCSGEECREFMKNLVEKSKKAAEDYDKSHDL